MKIGGERAYRLARRGVEVEMPLRRSTVYALDVIAYTGGTRDARPARQLGDVRACRSRMRSAAIASACAGRRSGPFAVADAVAPAAFEPSRLLPEAAVLARVARGGRP